MIKLTCATLIYNIMEENKKMQYQNYISGFDDSWKKDFQLQIENEEAEDFFFELAVRIMTRLDELGWKKSKFAEELGVSKQYVSKVLRAKENLGVNTIYKMSKVLGIKLMQIPPLKLQQKSQITIKLETQTVDYQRERNVDSQISYSTQKQINSKWPKGEMLKFQSRC